MSSLTPPGSRLIFWLRLLLPFLALVAAITWWLHLTLARPVGKVSIYGQVEHTNLHLLQERALPWLEKPFWRVDLNGLQASLEQDPWLSQVKVSRIWPNQIRLDLTERLAWAHWNQDHLIDTQGKGFNPGFKYNKNLSKHIYSQEATLAEAVKFWQYLDALLQPQGLQLTQLHQEQRGAWQLEFNSSIRVLVGRDNIPLRINRFIWAWQNWLEAEVENLSSIDLRYPNGLAVAWNTPTAKP